MKKINYVVRPYIHKSGRVMVRVRWNNSKIATVFTTESSADPDKWNKDANRAKINTTHNVKGVTYSSKDINARIENVLDVVSQVFYKFEVACPQCGYKDGKGSFIVSKEVNDLRWFGKPATTENYTDERGLPMPKAENEHIFLRKLNGDWTMYRHNQIRGKVETDFQFKIFIRERLSFAES